jgi:hypothetical protein
MANFFQAPLLYKLVQKLASIARAYIVLYESVNTLNDFGGASPSAMYTCLKSDPATCNWYFAVAVREPTLTDVGSQQST